MSLNDTYIYIYMCVCSLSSEFQISMSEEEYSWPLESFSGSSGFHKTTVVTRLRSGFASGGTRSRLCLCLRSRLLYCDSHTWRFRVVIGGAVKKSPNIGYNYSYPTYTF